MSQILSQSQVEKLAEHVNHEVELVGYLDRAEIYTLECVKCQAVILNLSDFYEDQGDVQP